LILLHTLTCLLSGSLGWYDQFLVVNISGVITIWVCLNVIHYSWKNTLLVVAPFYLIYIPTSIYFKSYQTFPIWSLGLFNCGLCYLILSKRLSYLLAILVLGGSIFVGRMLVMPNNFAYLYTKPDPQLFNFKNLSLVDSNDNKIPSSTFTGKIVVFDLWNTGCGVCIRRFPEFQSFYDKYKSDTNIIIATLNTPFASDQGLKPTRYLRKYSFKSFFATDINEVKQLPIEGYPLLAILDQKMDCVYAGDFNTGWNIFINNADKIIYKLKRAQ